MLASSFQLCMSIALVFRVAFRDDETELHPDGCRGGLIAEAIWDDSLKKQVAVAGDNTTGGLARSASEQRPNRREIA